MAASGGFTGTLTGNASTATKLAATKNINGVAFDGSSDITITASAGTLTGTTLNSTVTSSSLTGVGIITTGTWSGTAIAINKGGTGLTSTGKVGQVLTSTGSGTLTWTGTHYIGESYGGGIVFYVYDGGTHGLISANTDLSSSVYWDYGDGIKTMAYANGVGAGLKNTTLIIAIQGSNNYSKNAARLCFDYSESINGVTYGDWYLPSIFELGLMYANIGQGASSPNTNIGNFAGSKYWSSTEISYFTTQALCQNFYSGSSSEDSKSSGQYVRAIRSF